MPFKIVVAHEHSNLAPELKLPYQRHLLHCTETNPTGSDSPFLVERQSSYTQGTVDTCPALDKRVLEIVIAKHTEDKEVLEIVIAKHTEDIVEKNSRFVQLYRGQYLYVWFIKICI